MLILTTIFIVILFEQGISQKKKHKKLLDDGIITIEEFNAKKKELLGL